MSAVAPFFAFKSWAFHEQSDLSLKARAVGLAITDHMRKGRFTCFVSLGRLALLTGQGERSAWTAVQELVRGGYLEVQSGSRAGVPRANTYTLLRRDPRKACKGGGDDPRKKPRERRADPRNIGSDPRKPCEPSSSEALTDEALKIGPTHDAARVESIQHRMKRLG